MPTFELKHHYGWESCIASSAYHAVRRTHDFLTDDNHAYEDDGESVTIRKNQNSPPFALAPAFVIDGPGALWFSVRYRAPTPPISDHREQGE